MTECLYYADAYRKAFDASVVEMREAEGRPAVVLDATVFYPTGGGQPHDTGALNGVPVVDVATAEDGTVIHVLGGPLSDTRVRGELDWRRRFDHMQQHSGQHILSQAFAVTGQAETVSFHLGKDLCAIDLDQAPLALEQVEAAEQLANEVVMQDRAVVSRFVELAELATMPLRKTPTVDGPVRIVQIADFDWSPCGGTHVTSTGQVGSIKVTRVERRKKQSRISFVCGWRALVDYETKQTVVRALTAHLTTSEDEILPSVQRLEGEVKRLRKMVTSVQMQLLEHEVTAWLAQAKAVGDIRVIRLAFDDRDTLLLREAARRLTDAAGVVALLATCLPAPQFVFAASAGVAADMGQLMRAACIAVGGRGGGRMQFAQGGAPEGASADRALDVAVEQLGALSAGRMPE